MDKLTLGSTFPLHSSSRSTSSLRPGHKVPNKSPKNVPYFGISQKEYPYVGFRYKVSRNVADSDRTSHCAHHPSWNFCQLGPIFYHEGKTSQLVGQGIDLSLHVVDSMVRTNQKSCKLSRPVHRTKSRIAFVKVHCGFLCSDKVRGTLKMTNRARYGI